MLKSDDIQKKKDMLTVIGDVGAAVQTQKKTRKKKAAKGKKAPLEPAPIDAKYESLGSSLAQVSLSCPFSLLGLLFLVPGRGLRL